MAYDNKQQQSKPQYEKKPLKLEDLPITRATAHKFGMDETTLRLLVSSVVPDTAKDNEVAAFVYQSIRTGLDPMARQIYLVTRGGKSGVQTGIDGYRLIADRTGAYAGSSDPIFNDDMTQYKWLKTGETHPDTATITIFKAVGGVLGQFTATAAWDAYYPGEAQGYMWKKMPALMLSKVAEALALRKAFPAQLSGIYISEEMMQAGEAADDPVVDQIAKQLGYNNKNAIKVVEKLEEAGVDPVDARITTFLGMPITEVPNTAEVNDALKTVWTVAMDIRKGTAIEEAFKRIA